MAHFSSTGLKRMAVYSDDFGAFRLGERVDDDAAGVLAKSTFEALDRTEDDLDELLDLVDQDAAWDPSAVEELDFGGESPASYG
ncbi:MAG: hypothetical protein AAGF90_15100 [Pseudomonadota bacterium]